ncbi:PREDICTED: nodulation-signaling pathway 1 protein-like [Ipomoea nil]|uniref:nodulation-signaling pathway 1 protein-like n=1 Tax=Ipomoea nil TaxID=35883 RepID=UPI000901EF55|nr:PREDICTED: nodulation-signaling pathway 1 protein-like [Ipomoea nil]
MEVELTRRPGGPPPLVRLTVIDNHHFTSTPFLVSPPGYDFFKYLLGYAKRININLQINKLENFPLQNLNSQTLNSSPDEILIISAQFRLHNLSHHSPDDRSEFLRGLRNLGPKGVVLSENNADCSCSHCGDFANGLSRRVEYLWMEGEAVKALTNVGEMNECKEKWCQRMMSVGFVGQAFREDAIDTARAWLPECGSMEEKDADGLVRRKILSKKKIWLVSHGDGRRRSGAVDASLVRHRQHRRVIQEIFELHSRL